MAHSDKGLYAKYTKVHRTDGQCCPHNFGSPEPKHMDCQYFILDLTHDARARLAAYEYANLVHAFNPSLANDLFTLLNRLDQEAAGI